MSAKTQPRKALPQFNLDGSVLLSIGCYDGRELLNPEFTTCSKIYGIDVDEDALERAKAVLPEAYFTRGKAECLPYPRHHFDVVISRVALPYTDIQTSLLEISKVLRPDGKLFLMMHDWKMQANWLWLAVRGGHWKRVIDHAYVAAASAIYALTGRCVARPWNGRIETFQTQSRLKKQLERAGFKITRIERTRHIEIEAILKT